LLTSTAEPAHKFGGGSGKDPANGTHADDRILAMSAT
jgi:hypothetical protein